MPAIIPLTAGAGMMGWSRDDGLNGLLLLLGRCVSE